MKKIIKLLFIFVLLISLSGCHGQTVREINFVMPEEFDETKNYEITFWAKNDTNKTQVEVYEKAVEEFNKIYPNIKVNIKTYTDYGLIYNDVITNISTNTTPNICITYPDHIATYLTGENTVMNLGELMDDEKYGLGGSEIKFDGVSKDEIVQNFLDECFVNDDYYALPFMRSSEVLYINKTYVEKLGYKIPDILTWDFVFEVSEKAMALNDDGTYKLNGQNIMIPFIYKSTDNMMITMLKQIGADYSNDDGDILIFNDDTRRIMKEINSHSVSGAFSTFKISGYPANSFNAGKCIFAVDSTAGSTWMGSDAPNSDISEDSVVKFETIVKPIPQYDVDNPLMISQGPSICIFKKYDSQEVLASWIFAQYLLSNEVQISYSETEGYIPVTLKAQSDESYQSYLNNKDNSNYEIKIEATKLFIENIKNTFVTAVFNGSTSLRTAAGQLIEESVKTAIRGNEFTDEYIDKIYASINSLYRLDQAKEIETDRTFKELPKESKILLYSIGIAWTLIGGYCLVRKLKNKSN